MSGLHVIHSLYIFRIYSSDFERVVIIFHELFLFFRILVKNLMKLSVYLCLNVCVCVCVSVSVRVCVSVSVSPSQDINQQGEYRWNIQAYVF